jgi:Carboxypeptidase regulatory-like domain
MNKKLLAVAGCGLVLSACATTGSSASVPNGELVGVARLYGGPMRPDDHTMALNGAPGEGIRVTVTHGGTTVATTVTGSDGAFTFHLAPGRYVVNGCGSFPLVVSAGQRASHDLTCDVP